MGRFMNKPKVKNLMILSFKKSHKLSTLLILYEFNCRWKAQCLEMNTNLRSRYLSSQFVFELILHKKFGESETKITSLQIYHYVLKKTLFASANSFK